MTSAEKVWADAVGALSTARVRPEFVVEEVPAPTRLAPFALALAVDVVVGEDDVASGKFVVLHDPDGQAAWQGTYRVVTFLRAQVEPEMVDDELASEVAWSWLTEVLDDIDHRALTGTVTRTLSTSFPERDATETELEIRASWSPARPNLDAQFHAWLSMVEVCAGLVPTPSGTTALGRARR